MIPHDLMQLIADAYEKHGPGKNLIDEVLDKVLRLCPKEFRTELMREGIRSLQFDIQCKARSVINGSSQFMPKVFSKEDRSKVVFACGKYFNWPLMDGTRLGKANKEKLIKDIQKRKSLTMGHLKKIEFMSKICDRLQGEQIVEEVFNEEELTRLMESS